MTAREQWKFFNHLVTGQQPASSFTSFSYLSKAENSSEISHYPSVEYCSWSESGLKCSCFLQSVHPTQGAVILLYRTSKRNTILWNSVVFGLCAVTFWLWLQKDTATRIKENKSIGFETDSTNNYVTMFLHLVCRAFWNWRKSLKSYKMPNKISNSYPEEGIEIFRAQGKLAVRISLYEGVCGIYCTLPSQFTAQEVPTSTHWNTHLQMKLVAVIMQNSVQKLQQNTGTSPTNPMLQFEGSESSPCFCPSGQMT